jgi:phosphate transport system protein
MAGSRRGFDRELEAIEAKVVELFALIGEDMPVATRALLSGNRDVIPVLAEREQVIDALYLEVEGLAVRAILLQAPVASDLRFLLSVLRIVPELELERTHDLVMQIASRAGHIRGEDISPRSRGLVERKGKLASGMWRQAADSWYQRDRTAAPALAERDEEMGELHASLTAELAGGRMTLPVTMDMTLVAHATSALARTPSTSHAGWPTSQGPHPSSPGGRCRPARPATGAHRVRGLPPPGQQVLDPGS